MWSEGYNPDTLRYLGMVDVGAMGTKIAIVKIVEVLYDTNVDMLPESVGDAKVICTHCHRDTSLLCVTHTTPGPVQSADRKVHVQCLPCGLRQQHIHADVAFKLIHFS
jgi:hypothetical protein